MRPGSLRWLDAVGSTQDAAHGLAAGGGTHGSAIAARVQTAGRGTRRRQWVSSEGGLWVSVVCRPQQISGIEVVGLRVGLSLAALIDRWIPSGARIAIKWPNDLYLDDRKLGGILVEARWQGAALGWLAVGVGINIRNPLPSHLVPPATRLVDFGEQRTPEQLAPLVVAAVSEAAGSGAPLTPEEVRAFDSRDWLRGRLLQLPHPGIALGISDEGKLLIRTPETHLIERIGSVVLADETA